MIRREFLTEYPILMQQWDYEKNELDPTQLTAGSRRKVWWKCEEGHSWKALIHNRCRGSGCPCCAGKRSSFEPTDLQTCNSNLVQEWDFEKNTVAPSRVSIYSKKKAWWICEQNHSWEATIASRHLGSKCPYCMGKKVLIGFNDLKTLRPDLAQEWDYEKNKSSPSQFTFGSCKNAWWICSKGHPWKTSIHNRSNRKTGTGCPYCAGKLVVSGINDLQTLHPELVFEWDFDKNELLPSQVKVMSNKYIWWICGRGHSWEAPVYVRRTSGCPFCAGKRVLKGFNDLKTLNPELAIEWDYEKNKLTPAQVTTGSGKTAWWKCTNGHSWAARVTDRNRGQKCPHCPHKEQVQKVIRESNSLKPELVNEWDYDKNDLLPTQVTAGSSKSVWWKCDKGHSWKSRIGRRSNGGKCPYCNKQRLPVDSNNNLQVRRPDLAEEWDYDKNILTPSQVAVCSSQKVWWKCSKGHSWEVAVTNRSSGGNKCPYCSCQLVLEGFNDLQTRNPKLASEWDFDKNDILPTQIAPGSTKKAWWKCEKGHSWQAVINSRNRGRGCPYCIGQFPYTPKCVSSGSVHSSK